ncbi:MAG: ArsR/SmtB family transcription factor, partial [Polyangiales bacterium]
MRGVTRLPVQQSACCTPQKLLRPKSLAAFAKVFKALGDETRLEIVALLAASSGELCVCDLEA